MSAPDDFTFDASRGWSMTLVNPQLSGGATTPAPNLRSVAKESTAHGVPDGEPQQAGASPDARMMRAAIEPDPWLLLAGEFHASSDVEVPDDEDARRYRFDAEMARLFPEQCT